MAFSHTYLQAAKKTVKRREASSLLLPRQPLAQTDEASSLRQELNTKYRRIAELETRIHDLTLQQHMVGWIHSRLDCSTTTQCRIGNGRYVVVFDW